MLKSCSNWLFLFLVIVVLALFHMLDKRRVTARSMRSEETPMVVAQPPPTENVGSNRVATAKEYRGNWDGWFEITATNSPEFTFDWAERIDADQSPKILKPLRRE